MALPASYVRRASTIWPVRYIVFVTILVQLWIGAHANMIPEQFWGTWKLVPLSRDTTSCPEQLRVGQIETVSTGDGTIYVIPHYNISVVGRSPTDPGLPCEASHEDRYLGVAVSSTVLRRMDKVKQDRSLDLLDKFYDAGEVFYIGWEAGSRRCGLQVLDPGTVSMWAAPGKQIVAKANGVTITFQPNVKYIYYFDHVFPCLYEGNAAEQGRAVKLPKSESVVDDADTLGNAGSDGPITSGAGTIVTENDDSDETEDEDEEEEEEDQHVDEDGNIGTGGATVPSNCGDCGCSSNCGCNSGCNDNNGGGSTSTGSTESSGRTAKDNPECFPGFATVALQSGAVVRMRELRVGDMVHSGYDTRMHRPTFSRVYMFSHADKTATSQSPLVRIKTATNLTLSLTSQHLVIANGRTVSAASVRVGDTVVDGVRGEPVRVVSVDQDMTAWGGSSECAIDEHGLYAPHTLDGTIVVDGVVASCFTAHVPLALARLLLAPLRAYCILFDDAVDVDVEVVFHPLRSVSAAISRTVSSVSAVLLPATRCTLV